MARTLMVGPKGARLSRLRQHARNNLGVIMTNEMSQDPKFRNKDLEKLDEYYESAQYDDLRPWDEACETEGEYVPIRKRKPRIIYALPKLMVNKVAGKLTGSAVFPQFVVEDDDDDSQFLRVVIKASQFRRKMIEPMKHLLVSGAVLIRYFILNGSPVIEYYKSKYCYPQFDQAGNLQLVTIRYVYDDQQDLNQSGDPTKKWFQLTLGPMVDIAYDNPEYREGTKPQFNEVSRAQHDLGWVQAEWLVTHEDKFDFDGVSLFGDILDFCDDLNYSLSQSSQAVQYNQEPQLAINGMDEDEIDQLVKSSTKAWNLGRDGKAEFLDNGMEGVKQADEIRDKYRQWALDIARVVINDPEKMIGAAQSAKAMEILNGPLVELIDELRAIVEPKLIALLLKIAMTLLHYIEQGFDTAIDVPPGFKPTSMDVTCQWPPIFPPTLMDINTAAQAANSLSTGKIISRESLTRWIAQMMPNIDNIEEELSKIDAEPELNPFGSFGGGEPPGGK